MAPNSMAGGSPTPAQGAQQSTMSNGQGAMPSPFSPAGPDMGIDAVLKPLIDGSFAMGNSMPAAPGGQAAQQGATAGGKAGHSSFARARHSTSAYTRHSAPARYVRPDDTGTTRPRSCAGAAHPGRLPTECEPGEDRPKSSRCWRAVSWPRCRRCRDRYRMAGRRRFSELLSMRYWALGPLEPLLKTTRSRRSW